MIPATMTDFAAIDFEIANRHRSSICSVGLVVVRGGGVDNTYYSLIKPRPEYYEWSMTAIHDLDAQSTRDARTFPDVWRDIEPIIAGLPLVAHNAAFDSGCLKAAFAAYGMDYPGYTFGCTCKAARRHFGRQVPDYRLGTVSQACGYDLTRHHNALADAEACAHIAIHIMKTNEQNILDLQT